MRVQVRRGLVGEHERRLADDGPCDGHALLLTTRQPPGLTILQPLEPDLLEELPHSTVTLFRRHATEQERELRVLESRQHGQEVEGLEDEPDALEPEPGELLVREVRDLLVPDPDTPPGGARQPPQHVEQGRLPRAGRARHGHEVALADLEGHPSNRLDGLGLLGIDLPDVLGTHRDVGRYSRALGGHSNFSASPTSILVARYAG